MSYSTIGIEQDSRGVATLSLARAEKHNAFNAQMIDELTVVMNKIREDDSIRVVVMTGEGKSFCAGGDLEWMRSQFAASRSERLAAARALAMMLKSTNELPKPLIARVQGNAFGGGVGLMSVADIVIAVDSARFGLTETRLGLIPATISPYVIGRIGGGNARSVILSGKTFDCVRARHLGLVSQIVAPAALDAAIEHEIISCLAASPSAVAAAKAMILRLGRAISNDDIEDTIQLLADTWETADARQGLSAFFEGRRPGFADGENSER
jgi:methylglutaconyl-CoA hydratase